mmetsp:Transcript_257/g.552  ORF Transcript_257/g.552 Transcript_257/m.552 type:complete len:242 (+) Transcript_257:122-847(+)
MDTRGPQQPAIPVSVRERNGIIRLGHDTAAGVSIITPLPLSPTMQSCPDVAGDVESAAMHMMGGASRLGACAAFRARQAARPLVNGRHVLPDFPARHQPGLDVGVVLGELLRLLDAYVREQEHRAVHWVQQRACRHELALIFQLLGRGEMLRAVRPALLQNIRHVVVGENGVLWRVARRRRGHPCWERSTRAKAALRHARTTQGLPREAGGEHSAHKCAERAERTGCCEGGGLPVGIPSRQ